MYDDPESRRTLRGNNDGAPIPIVPCPGMVRLNPVNEMTKLETVPSVSGLSGNVDNCPWNFAMSTPPKTICPVDAPISSRYKE